MTKQLWRRVALAAAVATIAGGVVGASPASADLTAPDLAEAWSHTWANTGFALGSPVAGDLTGDGVPEIVVGGHDGWLHVFRADGSLLWEAPIQPIVGGPAVGSESSPTIADIDGDGWNEVIMGAQTMAVPNQSGGLVVFNHDGSVKWRWGGGEDIFNVWNAAWGTRPDGYREGSVTTAAVGDIDGDGHLEVVVAALDNRIHVLRGADGSEMPGWDSRKLPGFWIDDAIWASPAVFDGDGDGRDEIYVGRAFTSPTGKMDVGGVFMAIGFDGGAPTIEWQHTTGEVMFSTPAIADIDGDGRPEVVTGAGHDYAAVTGTPDARTLFAWHVDDGSGVAGWPKVLNGVTMDAPAIGDVDGDGKLDVVVGTFPLPGAGGANANGHVYAIRGDGTTIWEREPNQFVPGDGTTEPGGAIRGNPIIADVNGDGVNDVVISNYWATFTMDGRNGNRIWAPIRKGWSNENTPIVANFGAAGWRMILAGKQWTIVNGAGVDTAASIVALPIPAPGRTPPWGQWRGGPRHSGVDPSAAPYCEQPPTTVGLPVQPAASYHPIVPSRLLDTRLRPNGDRREVGAHCVMSLPVLGIGGVPASGVTAVTLNVTVTAPPSAGYVTAFPCGVAVPTVSNLNYVPWQSTSNLVTIPVGSGGRVCFYADAQTHIVADVSGWWGSGTGDLLFPVTPKRLMDTRIDEPGRAKGKVPAGGVLAIPVLGVGPVPASGVTAVSINLGEADSRFGGFLAAYPCGGAVPVVSNVNNAPDEIVQNHAEVQVGAGGAICIFSYAAADVVVDVTGYWGPGAGAKLHPLTPDRLLDTRSGGAKLGAGQTMRLHVLGSHGVPASAVSAVVMNVTAVDTEGDGYFTVYPCGGAMPYVSNLNYSTGTNRPGYVNIGVGDGGDVCIFTWATAHVVVDINGYLS